MYPLLKSDCDKLVVLNRNSLHLISGTTGSLTDAKVTQLTTEVGCLAKKSVVMKGNAMFFLSDDGVYAVEFLNDYNLRGADEPISKNIQPYIDRINKDLAAEAVAVLFNNRYFASTSQPSSHIERVAEQSAVTSAFFASRFS